MHTRTLLESLSLLLVAVTPGLAAGPADPSADVPPARYDSITAGTKSFRPVEPMPWGDVNRRVAPPGALPPPSPGKEKAEPTNAERKATPRRDKP